MSRRTFLDSLARKSMDMQRRRPSMRNILENIAAETGVTIAQLKSTTRRAPIAHARQLAFYNMYHTGKYSLSQIGGFMKRDHTTVLYGIRAEENRRALYAPFSVPI